MSNLALIKSEDFGNVKCDFWQNEQNAIFMTINQLAQALGYASKSGIENLIMRNEYIKNNEFSTTHKMRVVEGNREVSREMRVFTEDGIYEVTLLAGTEKAKEYRAWVRVILKSLRTGQAKIVPTTEEKKKLAEARLKNAKARTASIYLKIANNEALPIEYRQVLLSYATKELSDKEILPLPEAKEKTLSATEVGERLGISANKVGKITNAHNLKTEQYGKLFHDKSKYSSKEVEAFRYYENVIPVIKTLLEAEIAN
jgi:prophage antirepressor-like protein